jgi:uncharacterized protein (DUF885 family)
MKILFISLALIIMVTACKLSNMNQHQEDNKELAALFQKYYDKRMELFPLEATANGDSRFNNLLPADFTDSYHDKLKDFFTTYLAYLQAFDRENLNENDKISYDIFKYEMKMGLEGLTYHYLGSTALSDNSYFPFDQFNGVTITLAQMGSGTGNQPFKTVADYDNWLQRATAFGPWSDSAIVYFKKGMAANYVLPKSIVIKMIPQLETLVTDTVTRSLFYEPVKLMPSSFSETDKKRLTAAYIKLIEGSIVPSYKKLADFLKKDYLPKARTSAGINALPGGDLYYAYLVRYWTTTGKTPDEIYNTGLSEVKRIRGEMEQIKTAVNFNGDLNAFFTYMKMIRGLCRIKNLKRYWRPFMPFRQRWNRI